MRIGRYLYEHWIIKYQHDTIIYQFQLCAKSQILITLKDCQFHTKPQTLSLSDTLSHLYEITDITFIRNNVTFITNYRQQVHPKHCYFSKLHGVISNSIAITRPHPWEHSRDTRVEVEQYTLGNHTIVRIYTGHNIPALQRTGRRLSFFRTRSEQNISRRQVGLSHVTGLAVSSAVV